VKRLTSRHNPLVARFRAAARGNAEATILLDGPHLIGEALAAGLQLHDVVVSSADMERPEIGALLTALRARGVEAASASASVMDAVSPVKSPSSIVALAARPASRARDVFSSAVPLVIVATDVQDPGNAGAIVRTAEAGGATGVVMTGQSADPFGWKALRGSMGSALRLPIVVSASAEGAVAEARRHGCRIVAAVPRGGRSPFDTDLIAPTTILLGGEGMGIPDALAAAADERVTIPMRATVESLNTAITAAVLVYEAYRQRLRASS
jgi:TrmH family RNA methyltransferase